MSTGYANLAGKTLAGNFQATFALDLAHKDLRLALEMADELGVPGLIAPQVMNLLRMARGMGLGSSDSTSMVRVYETALNEEIRA
jgi:3-hydroxyisobutyrate dehydrogenase-like beta-hydroxyacid dehydrogenase